MKRFVCKKNYSPLILFLILAVSLVLMFLGAVFVICLVTHVGLTEPAEPTELTELTESVGPTEPTGPTVLYGTYQPEETDAETGMYEGPTDAGVYLPHPTIAGFDVGERFSLNMVSKDFCIKLGTTEIKENGLAFARLYYKDVWVAYLEYSGIVDFVDLQNAEAISLWTGKVTPNMEQLHKEVNIPFIDADSINGLFMWGDISLGDEMSHVLDQFGEPDERTKNENVNLFHYLRMPDTTSRIILDFDSSDVLLFFMVYYR